MRRRAVITGMGVVSALGQGVEPFWRGLIEARSGIGPIDRFDPTGLRNESAGQVRDLSFAPADFGLDAPPDLATRFLLVAAREAFANAGLAVGPGAPDARIGAGLSTNFGGCDSWEAFVAGLLAGEADADAFSEFDFSSGPRHLAEVFGIGGPCLLLSVACAGGSAALGAAADLVKSGAADVVLSAGYDALAPTPLSGLSVLRTITDEMIRPFSADRSGTIFGEGAAALVVEDLDHAQARGAPVICEVLGWAENSNAYHLTAPDQGGAGMTRVVAAALRDAGVEAQTIDYVNAHGTGTKPHDPEEVRAIRNVLGARACEIPVTSIKPAVGHMMGAAGSAEAVATALTIVEDVIPPTLNYAEPDPECDLDHVPNASRPGQVDRALSISAGIGGNNACVVLGAMS
ncbi:MAG TPA: beta-ketoacyl-[acyl-carrier-protein] synthase family protein [Armatimonadota bacterium]|nr:beta-ketoacyl-[acyl-carrier-protein] synthase family protein [Armatimonadota bacterium]